MLIYTFCTNEHVYAYPENIRLVLRELIDNVSDVNASRLLKNPKFHRRKLVFACPNQEEKWQEC